MTTTLEGVNPTVRTRFRTVDNQEEGAPGDGNRPRSSRRADSTWNTTIRRPMTALAASLSDVVSQPDVGEIELLVLAAVAPEGSTTAGLAEGLGRSSGTIETAVQRLAQGGLVETTGDAVTLTPAGRLASEHLRGAGPLTITSGVLSTIDLDEVSGFIRSLWPQDVERVAAEEAARDGLLASDADRDLAVQQLSEAFSQGRLSEAELEQRTGTALSARTYGDLDGALQGLGGLQRPQRSHPARKVAFWVVAVPSSPFVLLGTLFLAFGDDLGDRVFGLVVLILLLPGLLALRRWAWPRGGESLPD